MEDRKYFTSEEDKYVRDAQVKIMKILDGFVDSNKIDTEEKINFLGDMAEYVSERICLLEDQL